MDDGFKKPDDVAAKEKDVENVVAKDELNNELVAVNTATSERLPFSKARSVALVATVAAAPFLSVKGYGVVGRAKG
jgi:hypothetical protein